MLLLTDIIEGYFAIREMRKKGFFEDDNMRLADYIKACCSAIDKVKRSDENEVK